MTITNSPACRATATPIAFAAQRGGGFPAVLTEDDAEVTAPAGGQPMRVLHRYEDLLSVKCSPAWRMANRCETPLTGAEVPGAEPPGHMLGMDGPAHRKLRQTIGHLFTSDAADALRPEMRKAAAGLLDQFASRGTGDLRSDYAEPATAATVCAVLGVPIADWAPIIRPAGEIAFGVVQPSGGVVNAQAAWHAIWGYYEGVIAAKQASPDARLAVQMFAAMQRAGYTLEEVVRAVATVSNGATALLPVLERVLIWLLHSPDTLAEVFLGERTWAQAVREAIVQEALFPVTPPLVAGKDARIGRCPVPEGTLVLPSLVSAVRHPRGGAWLAFGPGQHRCPGDELTLAALEEYTEAFFRRYPHAYLTTPVLEWRDGPLSTPREARFAVRRLPSRDTERMCRRRARLIPLRSLPRSCGSFQQPGTVIVGRRPAGFPAVRRVPPGRRRPGPPVRPCAARAPRGCSARCRIGPAAPGAASPTLRCVTRPGRRRRSPAWRGRAPGRDR